MRYTIGTEIIDKRTNESFYGIYAFGTLGLSFVMTEKYAFQKEAEIMIFDNKEVAENYVRMLARAYRRDDVAFSPRLKSKKIRKFYLVKVDSANFPYKIKPPHREGSITRNCFNEEGTKVIGHYAKCYAYDHK